MNVLSLLSALRERVTTTFFGVVREHHSTWSNSYGDE